MNMFVMKVMRMRSVTAKHTARQHIFFRIFLCSSLALTSCTTPASVYVDAWETMSSMLSSSSPCCSTSSAMSRNSWCTSLMEDSSLMSSSCLLCTSAYAFRAVWSALDSSLSVKMSPPPESTAFSISSSVAAGLATFTWRATRSRRCFLYVDCTSWYSPISSTNLRVSAPCMFLWVRASDESSPCFSTVLSEDASIALRWSLTFFAVSDVSRRVLSSFSVYSLDLWTETSVMILACSSLTSLIFVLIIPISAFTPLTSSKNSAMKVPLAGSSSSGPPSSGLTSTTVSGAWAVLMAMPRSCHRMSIEPERLSAS
mmetsp:Transcript_29930/g.73653  ORF Transcript_29930/g.73653 Transcript_29930/m.73653 type:complete len:313 (+) Transcript_29930:47-985(+)